MPFPSNHEEFMQAVQNHLKERPNCPILVIVHTPNGIELQGNFADFALQMGILDIAKMTTAIAFDQSVREGFKTGENQMMVSNVRDAIDPDKKKVMN
jgi:hypothetical protein